MDPDHPIIEHPCRYSVVGFCFHRTLDDTQESLIDLTLQREQTVRRLRFLSPQAISIGEGFPHGQGLFIADIRRRGLEGLTVDGGPLGTRPLAVLSAVLEMPYYQCSTTIPFRSQIHSLAGVSLVAAPAVV